ncbi:putative lipid binding protein [Trypoxylus dichotomus]
MVNIVGKYQHVLTLNTEEFIKLVGVEPTEENVKALNSPDSILTVKQKNDVYSFAIRIGLYWERAIYFTLGKKFLEGDGEVHTVAQREGDKFTLISRFEGNTWKRIYDFTDYGAVITLDTGNGLIAKRVYRRLF